LIDEALNNFAFQKNLIPGKCILLTGTLHEPIV